MTDLWNFYLFLFFIQAFYIILDNSLWASSPFFSYIYLSARFRIYWLFLLWKIKTPPKWGILVMTVNCIRWWGSSSRNLGCEECFFVAIISRSTLTQNGGSWYGPIYWSNRSISILFVFDYTVCRKKPKKLLKQLQKMEVLDGLTYCYNQSGNQSIYL